MRRVHVGVVSLVVVLMGTGVAAQRAAAPGPARPGTGWVAGRIVRSDGLPQPEADVVLARRDRQGALTQLSWRARSGLDGRYEIAGVPPGRYLVLVRAIGGDGDVPGSGRPRPTLFPGVPLTEPGALVEVAPGISTEGIDIWLWPYPRRFTVSGRVFGPDGMLFEDLVIEFGRPGTRATDIWTRTDPGGLFSIDTAPPGPLVLRARATDGDRPLVGVAVTTVAVAPVEDIRITVRDPVIVTGQVHTDGGHPLPAGLMVTLVPEALRPSALYPAEPAKVGEDGRFAARSEPGPQMVVVGGLPAGWTLLSVAGDPRRATIEVPGTPASPARPVDVLVGRPRPKVP
jgi:hypothetical protein